MIATVVTTGPDSLRVEAEFHHTGELAGLIWDSVDTVSHPLLAYATDRDYSRTTLRFRWRSGGVLPLDSVHGPTLTIEGRDAAGAARSWYVRLWNYASGSPEDARIVLPFADLRDEWEGVGDAVHPADIDRMFISLSPPGYEPEGEELLPARVDGWVELSDIACQGHRPMLAIGDALVPPHGIRMATAFDDCYNQTPERLLRTVRHLGYRERIVHYLGMSHFQRLVPGGADLLVDPAGTVCGPALLWHANYFALCAAQGYRLIASISYELLAERCPEEWQQRAYDGTAGRTGWEPPSALLSPAHAEAMDWLKASTETFVELLLDADLDVEVQIGEPWWWTTQDGQICLYDDAASAAFGGSPPEIVDMRAPLSEAQLSLLDDAGDLLAQSTADLTEAIRSVAGDGGATVYLLAFTPTILDPSMPELHRANMPSGWAWPAFDRLQLEDYDWLTHGSEAARKAAYGTVADRLGYPIDRQDYFAGFVLLAEDADAYWPRIDAGLDEALARGITERFVWAVPQVCRDGYTRLPPSKDDDMQALDDVLYPLALGRDSGASPEFSTSVAVTASGHERRSSLWSDARMRYDVGPGIRSEQELGTLIAFFRARRGAARAFRLADPFDFSSNGMTGTPTMLDQRIGTADGLTATFQLVKNYGGPDDPQRRAITRPHAGSIAVSVGGVAEPGWTLMPGGKIVFADAPPDGAVIRAGFLFDVPVRFAEDRLDVNGAAFTAGEAPSVPLIEVREAA